MLKRIGEPITKGVPIGLFIFLSLLSASGKGQELSSSVSKNPVAPGERLTYTIELKGVQASIVPPDLSAFKRVIGPSKSTQVRVVNGQMSRSMKVSYRLVAPDRETTIKIQGAQAKTKGGERLKSSPIQLRVKKGGSKKTPSSAGTGQRNKKLMARINLSKSKVFKGEPVRVSYTLFSRYRRISFAERPDYPAIQSVWTEELNGQDNKKSQLVKIDGKPYRKVVLKEVLIFPQNSGEIEIEAMEASCRVNHGFFSKGKVVKVRSNSPTLKVEPLPQGAPEDFEGAVGNLDLKASLDRDTVKTNGSVNLNVRISGSGNLTLLEEPRVKIPPDLEHYDPNTKDRTTVGPGNMRGRKEWEYLIVPRQSGDYKVGPVSFSYFDPSEESYKTLRAGPFELRVKEEKAEGTKVARRKKQDAKEKVNVLDEELRYIRTEFPDLRKRGAGERSGIVAYLPALPPLLAGLLFLLWKERRKKGGNESSVARKTARTRLRDAEKALKKGDRTEFHEELYKGLQSYLSDRTGIPHAELSKERIRERMLEIGVPEEKVDNTLRTLQHSEMLRYAPSQTVSDEEVHEETVSLLAELESYWK